MKVKAVFALFVLMMYAAVATAQDRASLRPGFKAGDESRYEISASVDTIITPKGSDGVGVNSRGELTATVVLRTLGVTKEGEVNQEATVEAISLTSTMDQEGKAGPPAPGEIAGKKIVFATSTSGLLLRCSIPESPGYLALADLLFSATRWYPTGEVAVGGSWEASGQGNIYTDRLSRVPAGSKTVYKLASLAKGVASIEGVVALKQSGSSTLNTGGAPIYISMILNGKGSTRVDVSASSGRVISGVTDSRVEGTVINIQPTAEGEKMHAREGLLVETSKFSIKLIP